MSDKHSEQEHENQQGCGCGGSCNPEKKGKDASLKWTLYTLAVLFVAGLTTALAAGGVFAGDGQSSGECRSYGACPVSSAFSAKATCGAEKQGAAGEAEKAACGDKKDCGAEKQGAAGEAEKAACGDKKDCGAEKQGAAGEAESSGAKSCPASAAACCPGKTADKA